MGNCWGYNDNWGIIFNQSKEEIIYLLHDNDSQILRASISGQGDEHSQQNGDHVYHLKPGKVSMRGLENIDYDKVKFISILNQDGVSVMNRLTVKDFDQLRLKIRPDMSIKMITQVESKQLFQFVHGKKVRQGNCRTCENQADYQTYQKPILCRRCKKQFTNLWVCRFLPQRHCYCESCYQQQGQNRTS